MSEPTDVVPLSRWRALVARSRSPAKRVEALLADPAAATLVPQLPAEDFYYLVKTVGMGDAGDLLRLGSPEQVRACLDLDVWERDEISGRRLVAWLQALEELPARQLGAVVRELDDEVLATFLARHVRIHDRSLGEKPEPGAAVGETPDEFFLVEPTTDDGETVRTIERFIDRLYRADRSLAQTLLLAAKWGLPNELEEQAYRWRSGRLADLGFVEYREAVEVYRWLDPRSVAVTDAPAVASTEPAPSTLPAPFAEPLADDTFLGRALGAVDDGALLAAVSAALVTLLNRVLSADGVDPADVEAVRDASARGRDTLSLGLEHLAAGELGRAVAVLRAVPLVRVFRVGFSLTLELGRAARARGGDDPTLEPLRAPRPAYPCALDASPTAGSRPFRTLADVRRVEAYLAALGGDARA